MAVRCLSKSHSATRSAVQPAQDNYLAALQQLLSPPSLGLCGRRHYLLSNLANMSARPTVLELVHEAAVLTDRTLQRPLDLLTSCAKAGRSLWCHLACRAQQVL